MNKATGPDGLPPALLKFRRPALAGKVRDLLLKLWEQVCVPTDLGRSDVLQVFKAKSVPNVAVIMQSD